jgi:PAS domain S-box-containing protein
MKPEDHPSDATELRARAKAAFQKKAAQTPESLKTLSPEATEQLLHELRVHQIELEMQNEELRRSQVELNVSRARYFDLYDLAPVGYVTLSESGLVQQANLTIATLLGVTRADLIKQPLCRFIQKEDADSYYLMRKVILETGVARACDLRLVKSDGTIFWAHLTATVNSDESGAPILRLTLSSIEEREEYKRELQEKEERLSLATIHNGIGIWDWNLITQKMIWDDSMFALYHISREDFSGTEEAWRAYLHPDDLERGDQEIKDAISGKRTFDTDFRVVWPNGEIHHIKAVAKIFRDENGTPLRMLGTNWDITARKLLEAAVTTAAEEERCRIARDLHDGLGQELASTLFLSNVLQRDLTERGATEAAQAAQIHALIEQSLAASREIARGLYPVPPGPDGLMTALQNLADQVTRGSHIECSFDTDSAVLIDDLTLATHLYRIAQEAVNNAFKHSGSDRIDIRLTATASTLKISVRDHGTGLPQNPPASTGLGRKTMEHRAQLTGGQLTVQNAPEGGGVIVSCSVPRVRRNPIETMSDAPRGKKKEPA